MLNTKMFQTVESLTRSGIVESNPGKFRLGDNELQERRDFVERTRKSVQVKFIIKPINSFINIKYDSLLEILNYVLLPGLFLVYYLF